MRVRNDGYADISSTKEVADASRLEVGSVGNRPRVSADSFEKVGHQWEPKKKGKGRSSMNKQQLAEQIARKQD
jgi:hypothetical protein